MLFDLVEHVPYVCLVIFDFSQKVVKVFLLILNVEITPLEIAELISVFEDPLVPSPYFLCLIHECVYMLLQVVAPQIDDVPHSVVWLNSTARFSRVC